MYTPPGMPRSRSFTRFTMRVGLLHFGQSVLFDVSITFLRSAVLAILAMETLSPQNLEYRYVQGASKAHQQSWWHPDFRREESRIYFFILQQKTAAFGTCCPPFQRQTRPSHVTNERASIIKRYCAVLWQFRKRS